MGIALASILKKINPSNFLIIIVEITLLYYYTILHTTHKYRLIDFLPIIDIDICYTFIVLQWTRRISIENLQLITRTSITRTMSRRVQAETLDESDVNQVPFPPIKISMSNGDKKYI